MGWSRAPAIIAMLAAWLGTPDLAAAETRLSLTVSGSCPSRDAVIAELDAALTDLAVLTGKPEPASLVIVSDDAAGYRVEVGGTTRSFLASPGNCDERARTVAVVVALALQPPVVDVGPPRTTTPAIEVGSQELSSRPALQIETGAVFDGAPFSDAIGAGADFRLAIGRADRQVVVGGAVIAPMLLAVTGARVRVQRVPIDLALRLRVAGNRIAAVLDLGPRFTIQRSDGVEVMASVHALRLETGVRLAGRLEVWPWRQYGAYLVVQGEWVPLPSRFVMPDLGLVGEMPSLWVGASVGLAVRMH